MSDHVPEFSRLVDVSRIPAEGLKETVSADPGECERLAQRLGVVRILTLAASFTLTPWRHGGVRVRGQVSAQMEQTCVVSLETFVASVSENVERYFAGDNEPGRSGVVVDVDSLEDDEPDLVRNGHIDLGELAAETLVLAIDPYPRKPGAVFAGLGEETAGDQAQQRENPFKALEKLTKK
jgi:uncharacterized metal-binding protein YceD (DUF177 family)